MHGACISSTLTRVLPTCRQPPPRSAAVQTFTGTSPGGLDGPDSRTAAGAPARRPSYYSSSGRTPPLTTSGGNLSPTSPLYVDGSGNNRAKPQHFFSSAPPSTGTEPYPCTEEVSTSNAGGHQPTTGGTQLFDVHGTPRTVDGTNLGGTQVFDVHSVTPRPSESGGTQLFDVHSAMSPPRGDMAMSPPKGDMGDGGGGATQLFDVHTATTPRPGDASATTTPGATVLFDVHHRAGGPRPPV